VLLIPSCKLQPHSVKTAFAYNEICFSNQELLKWRLGKGFQNSTM